MLRRTVHYLFRDDATAAERRRLLRTLAFVGLECPTARSGDYGDDIAGGSGRLLEIPPWDRTPRFHARAEGPPSNYDAALHLDFDDEAGLAAYESHPAALDLARLAAPLTVGDLTARVDWRFDGEPPTKRGLYRHSAMFVWRDDVDGPARSRILETMHDLAGVPGLEVVITGESASGLPADFDWVLDVQLSDEPAAMAFLSCEAYREAAAAAATATKHEWTSRVTHMMRGT